MKNRTNCERKERIIMNEVKIGKKGLSIKKSFIVVLKLKLKRKLYIKTKV
jgi:hypothetical protein